jgi:hypothetical protein
MFLAYSIFFSFLIIAIPIFSQRTSYQSIDEKKFKLYKIKKFGFLFKGMQGQSASNHGVIMPMLIIQIQGYILGLLSFVLIVIKEAFLLSMDDVFLIIIITLFIHTFVVVMTTAITGFVGNRRNYKRRK